MSTSLVHVVLQCEIIIAFHVLATHLWGATESGGGSFWLNAFFAQPEVRQHHMTLQRRGTCNPELH